MRTFVWIISLLFIAASCQDIPSVKKPADFIDAKSMESIMYESALVDAARGYNSAKLKLVGISPETYIYEKFNIDSSMYAQNLEYYSSDINKFKEMNGRVLKRIQLQFAIDDSLETLERKIKDSLHVIKTKEIARENMKINSLRKNKPIVPIREVTDSFARRYRGPKTAIDSI